VLLVIPDSEAVLFTTTTRKLPEIKRRSFVTDCRFSDDLLDDAIRRVCERIGIQGRAIVWPYAEPCMDIDKPNQLELLREDLAKQQLGTASKEEVGL